MPPPSPTEKTRALRQTLVPLRRIATKATAIRAPRLSLLLIAPLLAITPPSLSPAAPGIGLPFSRSYSLDEIGVSRGVTLTFDPIGRLAVIDGDKYVVLNDSTWINLLEGSRPTRSLLAVANDELGNTYFGALASWGVLQHNGNGKLQARPLQPEDCPAWVNSTNFDSVVPQGDGVYFAGGNGIVYWDRSTGEQIFIEAPDTARVFAFDSKVFVSTHSRGVQRLDLAKRALEPVARNQVINRYAILNDGKAVISTTGRRLALFDGERITDWENTLGSGYQPGPISNLLSLPDGGIATSIDGRGLYILSPKGDCQLALSTPEYHRINDLACQEPGVLWVATERNVQKLLYNDPVSILDQRSGLSVSWPQVIEWQGRPLIASHGRLFETIPSIDGLSLRFRRVSPQPAVGAMGIAAVGDQLLVGNGDGVFTKVDSGFQLLFDDMDVTRLAPVGEDLCFAIGQREIALLRWDGSRWSEAAERVEGVGFPFISLGTKDSAWIELGVNRVARISFEQEKIEVQALDDFPWQEPSWVHVGIIDERVALVGSDSQPLYFDEDLGEFVEDPELDRLFQEAPKTITRILQDPSGTIWAAHEEGIYAIHREGSEYRFDLDSFKTMRERAPIIQRSGTDDIWISTGTALYRIDQDYAPSREKKFRPFLVSTTDTQTRNQLYSVFNTETLPKRFPYSQNHLEFLFFGGSYASARSPSYEFKMSSHASDWTISSSESSIALANLQEGDYQLVAQLSVEGLPLGEPVVTSFSISAPWFRSPAAYTVYWTLGATIFLGSIALASTRNKRRQIFLEKLVQERTEELRAPWRNLAKRNATPQS